MALTRTSAPAELPLTLDEVKAHLRVTASTEDADIAAYLRQAVSHLDGGEGLLNRALVTQSWALTLDDFPRRGLGLDLPLPPLQSVTSITYIDADGATQTLASSVYRVLNAGDPMRRGRIVLDWEQSWPSVRGVEQAVTITFVAGYGARNAVPEHVRALLLALVKEFYDHRDPLVEGGLERSPALRGLFAQSRFPAL